MRWKDEGPTDPPSARAVVIAGAVALFLLGAVVLMSVGARVVF